MSPFHCLWFFVDIDLACAHISGICNGTADHLSSCNLPSFFSHNPEASVLLTPLLQVLLQITAVTGPDWKSPTLIELFTSIISKDQLNPHTNLTILQSSNTNPVMLYNRRYICCTLRTKTFSILYNQVYLAAICNLHITTRTHNIFSDQLTPKY